MFAYQHPTDHLPGYYPASAHPFDEPAPLEGQQQADVCIVGGGFTGLGAALRLAEGAASVRLLEAGPIGWGASGRNGGQIHMGLRREQEWLEQRIGDAAAAGVWRMAIAARDDLDNLVARHSIACDMRDGLLYCDHTKGREAENRRHADHMARRYGYEELAVLGRDEVRSIIASPDYHGGLSDARGGHLHPLNLALGMARAAIDQGAHLHSHSLVTSIRRTGDEWLVSTDAGSVRAAKVILATGAYGLNLNSEVARRVMPINNFIAVTEVLGPEQIEALIRGGIAVSDSRFVVYYFRPTADHRLLFGGGETYSYRFPGDIAAFVKPHMLRIFPQLADIRLDYAWGGSLCITPNRLPFVREVEPGLINLNGYSGVGVVLAPFFGKVIAEALLEDEGYFRMLQQFDTGVFPGGPMLRWPTLAAAMMFFGLRDRLGF